MKTTTTMDEKKIREAFDGLITTLETVDVHEVGIIGDYPIGGANRGKCALQVETNKNGWRTVKTTTSKNGRWCSPKKSTYRTRGSCFVASGPVVDKEFGWLSVGIDGVMLSDAVHNYTYLLKSPFSANCVRHKAEVSYGTPYEADDPEVLAAWLEWTTGLQTASRMMKAKLDAVKIAKELATKTEATPA